MEETDTKSTENYTVEYLSELTVEDCKALVGKTIKHILGSEYGVVLTFTDNSSLEITGHTYSDCSLTVEYNADKS